MGREKHLPGGELGVWGSLCGLGGGCQPRYSGQGEWQVAGNSCAKPLCLDLGALHFDCCCSTCSLGHVRMVIFQQEQLPAKNAWRRVMV